MKTQGRLWLVALVVLMGTSMVVMGSAWADIYPNKPIEYIVTFATGGTAEVSHEAYLKLLKKNSDNLCRSCQTRRWRIRWYCICGSCKAGRLYDWGM
jgi:hypothetical protein